MLINSKDSWVKEYKKDKLKIWFWIYFDEDFVAFNDYNDWFEVIALNRKITKIKLQFRSRVVEHIIPEDCDGVYLVRSILCKMSDEDYIHTTTVGLIYGEDVDKTVYINTGLIERYKEKSKLSDCFSEAAYLMKG